MDSRATVGETGVRWKLFKFAIFWKNIERTEREGILIYVSILGTEITKGRLVLFLFAVSVKVG